MPGLDKENFVGVSDKYLSEFLCGICKGVFVEPVLTPCGHLYCKDCITESLKRSNTCPMDMKHLYPGNLRPPSQAYINLLNDLQIKCNFSAKGCLSVVKVSELEEHSKYCTHNPNRLCKDCGIKYETKSSHNCLQNLHHRLEAQNEEIQTLKNVKKMKSKKPESDCILVVNPPNPGLDLDEDSD